MELILVIALFSVFFSIAIPRFSIVNMYQENMELKMLQKDLRQARSQAIVDNEPIFVYFYPSINEYEVLKSQSDIIKRRSLKRVRITYKNFDKYTFNPSGAIGGAGTVTLKKSNGDLLYLSVGVASSSINLKDKE